MSILRLEELLKDIFHLDFDTQYDLASTFLRFQEHYESPEFRGKVFSLEEYMRYYTANSPSGNETGRFTYYEDWGGFNIPSHVLDPFYAGSFDPISPGEKALLDAFVDRKGDSFYIIGTSGEHEDDALQHELAHGLFYTDDVYRSSVLSVLDSIDAGDRQKMEEYLGSSCGYHPEVFDDEVHAYLLTDPDLVVSLGIRKEVAEGLRSRIRDVFVERSAVLQVSHKVCVTNKSEQHDS